ncbi:hypothetical protein ACT7DQ_22325 [Bacillus cereus]
MEEEQILTTQKEEKPFKAFVRSQIYFLKLIYKEYPKSFFAVWFIGTFILNLSPINCISK